MKAINKNSPLLYMMTMEEFVKSVKAGAYIDYDGFGQLATEDEESDVVVVPSDVTEDWKPPEWATHVVWYNR